MNLSSDEYYVQQWLWSEVGHKGGGWVNGRQRRMYGGIATTQPPEDYAWRSAGLTWEDKGITDLT